MNCTFLGHSAFLVETESELLLFDYTEGVFELPSETKPLFVFVSHRHSDHYNRSVLSFAKREGRTTFVLSNDIPSSGFSGYDVVWVGPHEKKEVGGLGIETLRSTDEGVAFVLTVGGRTLYYAGDLNHWHWSGESEAYNTQMAEAYRAELDRLPPALDVAFVPVDPRLQEAYSLGAKDLVERCNVSTLVPMHFWGDLSVCSRVRDELAQFDGTVVQLEEAPYRWRIE
jgi:L-ascorbate metabolism protein UlaG (beta-lactamase superfamily)